LRVELDCEKASVAPAQARAFVRAIEIEIAGARDTLATKHDLLISGRKRLIATGCCATLRNRRDG
jgi:hypothetical protein